MVCTNTRIDVLLIVGPVQRKLSEHVVIVVAGETQLLEIVLALSSTSCLTSLLDGGEQEGDQDRNDSNYHKELDQRKRLSSALV